MCVRKKLKNPIPWRVVALFLCLILLILCFGNVNFVVLILICFEKNPNLEKPNIV